MSVAPSFPPLLSGIATAGADPFAAACDAARAGCEGGTVFHDTGAIELRAAVVFAPEVPLRQAVAMGPLCAVAFQNALGALGPPELAIHLEWGGGLRLNGGRCGAVRMAAAGPDPVAVPDWLVVGLDLRLWPAETPGAVPDETALYAEGCGDITAPDLIESWARHMLTAIHRWEEEGPATLHRDWEGLAWAKGERLRAGELDGTFLGIDADFGLLLKTDAGTRLIPLTTRLEDI